MERGYLLVAQELRELAKAGRITGIDMAKPDHHIKSASIDLRIGTHAWYVQRELATQLRWERDIVAKLESLPPSLAGKVTFTMDQPFQTNPSFSYVAPCQECIDLGTYNPADPQSFMRIINSPKSTSARRFADVRTFFEGRSQFDEVDNLREYPVRARPWVLLDSHHFSSYLFPNLDLTQLRVSVGEDSKLSAAEIREEHKKYGLVWHLGSDGVPIKPVDRVDVDSNGNIRIKVNLHSRDGKQKLDKIAIVPGHGYLLESQEYLKIPPHLSFEMTQYTANGIRMITHKGGFFDPNFEGTAIGEIESAETVTRDIHHGERVYSFAVHRHNVATDKPYGVGSNYQKQIGARFGKNFFFDGSPLAVIGWKTITAHEPIDLRKVGHQDILNFFEPILGTK